MWQASLALPDAARRDLWALLSVEERAQAERYRSERDRERFAAAHGVLRLLLADYLTVAPADLRFVAGPHGKPDVVRSSGRAGSRKLRFNLAHSARLVVCVLGAGREVGVDVEDLGRRPIEPGLVTRYFAPSEVAGIDVGAAGWERRFLSYWTLKEAYLKARGLGISVHLADVAFALDAPGTRTN